MASKKISPTFLLDFIQMIEDPRVDRTKKHSLENILVIGIAAILAGSNSWVEMEEFGKIKLKLLSSFLDLSSGIPSHDTFRRLFMIISPTKLFDLFSLWVKSVTEGIDPKQICIDGKTLRGSRRKKGSPIHMVNAWCCEYGMSLGQLKTEEKTNEMKMIPQLLDMLEIKGTIVSMDALNCQVEIANKILEEGGDYLLAVKGNQSFLEERIKQKFSEEEMKKNSKLIETHEDASTKAKHGRIEKRVVKVLKEADDKALGVNPLVKWPELKTVIQVYSEVVDAQTGELKENKRYYVSSSNNTAFYFANAIRNHWQVENNLHWVLDVNFKEDDSRCRVAHSAGNFSTMRQLAFNMLKKDKSKGTFASKKRSMAWDDGCLIRGLFGVDLDA